MRDVTAGMDKGLAAGPVGEGESVHIRPQADVPALLRPGQGGQQPRLRQMRHLKANGLQPGLQIGGGPVLPESRLRNLVQGPPVLQQLIGLNVCVNRSSTSLLGRIRPLFLPLSYRVSPGVSTKWPVDF